MKGDPDTRALVGALLDLMEDPDEGVRMVFSRNIKHFLEAWNGEGYLKEVGSISADVSNYCQDPSVVM